jgi:hypothetical protein
MAFKRSRSLRARDPHEVLLERVLAIEHKEISSHKQQASIIIDPPPEELEVTEKSD